MAARERYAGLTGDQFAEILEEIVGNTSASALLGIPGIYDILSEELNNVVLERWEQDHPEDSGDVWDEDAPKAGDLVFRPLQYNGMALQSAYASVERVNNREGIQTYNVDLDNGDTDVPIEFYDSAWFLNEDYAAGLENEELGG